MEIQINQERCKGCDLCLNLCPKQVFEETENMGSKGFRLRAPIKVKNCSGCELCRYFCPEGAIILKEKSLLDEFGKKIQKMRERALSQNQPRGGWKRAKTNFPGRHFISGNTACVWGALDAGCRFFAGYPITPASEQSYEMEKRLRELDGIFIQMENEDASLAAICGASFAGAKCLTATSGPGFSRLQENLSFALTNEIPLVIVDVQRTGPGTGRPTGTGAGEIREARWGSHGGTEHIVLYPSTVQEIYDCAVKALNLSEIFRVPVILILEASNAHLEEMVEIPEEIEVFDRIYIPGAPPLGPTKDGRAPSLPSFGDGEFLKITGLTHDRWGNPCPNDSKIHEQMVEHQRRKIVSKAKKLTDIEEYLLDDAEIMIVAYGQTARAAKWAVKEGRKRGKKAGLLTIRLLYPFPEEKIKKWSKKVKCVLVPEMNQGQLYYVVRELSLSSVISLPQPDGETIDPRRILEFLGKDLTRYFQRNPAFSVPTFYNPPEWQRKKEKVSQKNFDFRTPFCPGCGLGILRNCLLEAIKELGWDSEKVVIVSGIGCTARSPNHLPFDSANTTHGYAVPFAVGVKLVRPDLHVIVLSGDGDLFNIGAGQTLHGARIDLPIPVICFNNWVFGMTGGQVASTTPFGAKTSSTMTGNKEKPFDLVKLMFGANAKTAARCPVSKFLVLKKILKDALASNQFFFIEAVSPCFDRYRRLNELPDPAECFVQMNRIYLSKEAALKTSKAEKIKKFKDKIIFPFRESLAEESVKEKELLQLIYGQFSDLKEYINFLEDKSESEKERK